MTIDFRLDTLPHLTDKQRHHATGAAAPPRGSGGAASAVAQMAADMGFEAGVWLPTRSMANLIGISVLAQWGDDVLAESRSQVAVHDRASLASIGRVIVRCVSKDDGVLTHRDLEQAHSGGTFDWQRISVVTLENAHAGAGGSIYRPSMMCEILRTTAEMGMRCHVDGTWLWHAAAALDVAPRALVAGADTVVVPMSDSAATLAGCVLLGSSDRMQRARLLRQRLGGTIRKLDAVIGERVCALEAIVSRARDAHLSARALASALSRSKHASICPVLTNIVIVRLSACPAVEVAAVMRRHGILVTVSGERELQLMTLHGVGHGLVEETARVFDVAIHGVGA